MNPATKLAVQDVRCFQGEQSGNLRPITLLVGENSTGKSTFLGCYRAMARLFSGEILASSPDFNEKPFLMGSFRDIVRLRRGPAGRINEFKLAMSFESDGSECKPFQLCATFSEQGAQPTVSSLRWTFSTNEFVEAALRDDGGTIWRIPGKEIVTDIPFLSRPYIDDFLKREPAGRADAKTVLDGISQFFPSGSHRYALTTLMFPVQPNIIPVAPLRSKPKRTYDPVRETASPDGADIPMLMMLLHHTNKKRWDSLHSSLIEFGQESGLFQDIQVKRHGREISDPFQLRVKVQSASPANIMDVGYGVSQSLPILVDILAADEVGGGRRILSHTEPTFLLQQPEVHLHPRGQAALATLFVESFKRHNNRFLIETHSDYIIDRVRILVRQERLNADDVSILYFEPEPHGKAVTIHNLSLDEHGNLKDVPPGYRDFFAKETNRLLGFED